MTNVTQGWAYTTAGLAVLAYQRELLFVRDLVRPICNFFIERDELPTACARTLLELTKWQKNFITKFAKDGRDTFGTKLTEVGECRTPK